MAKGILFITVRTADSAFPVREAYVKVLDGGGVILGEDTVTSGNGAVSRDFELNAPEKALSLSPREAIPYATYDVSVEADGFYSLRIRGVQIFAEERSELPVQLIPRGASVDEEIEYDIGPHALRLSERRSPEFSEEEAGRILKSVFIPEKVTVHLGRPDASAANVSVPFPDYIKNVASSEIYPTWPEASLRANVLCQISFVLNRIFTEWYPSRGYNFNITNSTAFDQYFVYGRNIYDSISRVVDDIFNEYIRRPGRIDPYFAEYCNGSTVTCAGLSQWGTVPLAEDGLSPLEILQFYYGDVEIAQTTEIRAIESSYGGFPLSVGSSGEEVRSIQQQLNRIRVNYPSIPAISPVDGVFGSQTQAAVRAFQQIFDLTPDGIVGKSTWYRISYIYVAVKKLAELNSEGERPQYDDNRYPGLLRFGDTGTAVQTLQYYLKTVAAFNPFLRDVAIDGRFGRGTEEAVKAFQSYYGLPVDGIVGENTWNRLVQVYLDMTEGGEILIRPYPGVLLREGSSGSDVLYVQMLLNRLRGVFVTVPALEEDGIFGPRMVSAVREFQRLFGLGADGIVGRETWNRLNRVFGSVTSGCLDDGRVQTGRLLRFGSAGADVSALQRQLNTVGSVHSPIPGLTVDGQYGSATERAVRVFQRIFGLGADGIVGNATRTRLKTVADAVTNGCFAVEREASAVRVRVGFDEEKEIEPSAWPEDCLWASPEKEESAPSDAERLEIGGAWPRLALHSSGRWVRLLKELMLIKGYLPPALCGDKDRFGEETERAIRALQYHYGKPETGEADDDVWEILLS
ncbi:MAG: peptidoglycan-binding protein [Clostridia bacterium]|nr:peptidoglycan-binding protein [Clostridia bacterium]